MSRRSPQLHVALPSLAEGDWIERSLESLTIQTRRDFQLWACINQPDEWHNDPDRSADCESNRRTLMLLEKPLPFPVHILDRCSPGRGWKRGRDGVGWARKTIMDRISEVSNEGDVIISVDADTEYDPHYLACVAEAFSGETGPCALSSPYYHRLTGDESVDRAILRYEIYLRCYCINLFLIGSPYAYCALGSALALPVSSYRAVRGMTPKKAGEDFYFLQKLAKYGSVGVHLDAIAFPAARFSSRVPFGTGAAMNSGCGGDWSRYPIFPHSLFESIRDTISAFPSLHKRDRETPMDEFFRETWGDISPWSVLRANHPDERRFVRACHERVDGLRMLQFLRRQFAKQPVSDEAALADFLEYYGKAEAVSAVVNSSMPCLGELCIRNLDAIRNHLFEWESELRRSRDRRGTAAHAAAIRLTSGQDDPAARQPGRSRA